MKKTILCGILLLSAAALRAESYDAGDRQKLMEQHYSRAIEFYNQGNFSRAIYHWEQILKIDPDQAAPPDMIRQARAKLAGTMAPIERALMEDVANGLYMDARRKATDLADKDPSNNKFRLWKMKLDGITAVREQETGKTKPAVLVRRGLKAHLTDDDQAAFAVNALRYARDVAPKHPGIDGLVSYIEGQYPEVAKREKTADGMSVVENKLFVALNNIYAGRYDLTIFACNEVLELEPNNLLALKRKGSAYFALEQKAKAREIWKQALKVAPNDTEIKKFLAAK